MELIYEKGVIKMSKLKTVLITGNNGFIGSYFVKKNHKKYNIIGLDKEEAFDKNVCATQYIGDICNRELIQNIFENHDIDIVIHTAAEKSLIICENNKEDVYEMMEQEIHSLYEYNLITQDRYIKCKLIINQRRSEQ